MKRTYFIALSAATLFLASCAVEETKYSLDGEATTLEWTGKYVADGHTHSGSVNISEGTIVYKGEEFVSGEFKIDLASLEDTDLEAPMKDTLESHLNGMYFFNTAQNKEAVVKVNEISNNEIKATISLMGKEVKAVMPVKYKKDENGISATGKFTIDFASAGLMGFNAAPGDPENAHVDSNIEFEINLVLKK